MSDKPANGFGIRNPPPDTRGRAVFAAVVAARAAASAAAACRCGSDNPALKPDAAAIGAGLALVTTGSVTRMVAGAVRSCGTLPAPAAPPLAFRCSSSAKISCSTASSSAVAVLDRCRRPPNFFPAERRCPRTDSALAEFLRFGFVGARRVGFVGCSSASTSSSASDTDSVSSATDSDSAGTLLVVGCDGFG